ncbi:nucleoside hydrolase-like domain-containing protein [Cellvibrio sp. OA-2007]|uniref:nucleoside hydrolase-like domain-containing protein n=1 Tax=Cellvibrio sp. OA-2007 TaxID=529823 RepID=UPI000A87C3F0|nr:nucleoside hydrolase-like domain-containing protein [Cellvibrio sp. OA-2007]
MKRNFLTSTKQAGYSFILSGLALAISTSSWAATSTFVLQEQQPGFCSVDGTIDSNNAGFTGNGFANSKNATGAMIKWAVNASESSRYTLTFRYANGGSGNRKGTLLLNGGTNGSYTLDMPSTGSWTKWQTVSIDVDLVQDNNNLQLTALTADGLANIDSLSILGAKTSAGICGAVSSSSSSKSAVSSSSVALSSKPAVSSSSVALSSKPAVSSVAASSALASSSKPSNSSTSSSSSTAPSAPHKTRVIVTSDGEIDDECSLVRFLLYTNEWDVEGIITTSSQYHWQGHNWAGDNWQDRYLDAYEKVYPNLIQHDPAYPTPSYLRSQSFLGNVKAEGDMEKASAGSDHIVKVLLDASDPNPVWLQAWGGVNTIARALKTIEEQHPERMQEVAGKIRLFLIWEQDKTYQDYIRKVWGKYNIPTIISDQFITLGYWWEDWDFPAEIAPYFEKSWFSENLLVNHGPLMALYQADKGAFRSEGDSPAFLHTIPNGLRSTESPGWGGWGGRYKLVRENTWLDPVPVKGYTYPAGRWYTTTGWGRKSLRDNSATQDQYREYFKPITRWIAVMQKDFAARADWTIKPYKDANHEPKVMLGHAADLDVKPGDLVELSAMGTYDPDGNKLSYTWWQYQEADSAESEVTIFNPSAKTGVKVKVPDEPGKQVHIILEVIPTANIGHLRN